MGYLKLLLVRHGQSQGNRQGRMEGWHSSSLTALGEEQSEALGKYLVEQGWHPTHIYCSPLLRARASLEAIARGFRQRQGERSDGGIPAHSLASPDFREDLRESHQGIFTDLTWAEACDRYPDLCHRLETTLDWQPVPAAESPLALRQRAQGFVDHLIHAHANGDRLWVITHHGILLHIIARLLGSDRTWKMAIGNTRCFEFWIDHSRWQDQGINQFNPELWQIKRFNDGAHLEKT